MTRLAWTRSALRDLDRIQDFVARDNPPAAFRLIGALLDRTASILERYPDAGRPGRVEGTRELVVGGLPYIVVYRRRERIEILAIVHSSREWPAGFDA